MSNETYDALIAHAKQTAALGQIAGLLEWDQEVMMPPDGAEGRSEQAAALEAVSHERRADPRIGEWLEELSDVSLNEVGSANVRLIRRSYERSQKIPPKLAEELARTTALAQGTWAKARAANSFADFAPMLGKIIDLRRQEAKCLSSDDHGLYNALLDDYEPGMTVETLQPLLEGMRPRLTALRERIADSSVEQPKLNGPFDTDAQLKLARKLADVMGYKWSAGRLDLSVHPFSSGTGGDSRITTRVDPDEPLGCLYSTIHELGHALYEQGLSKVHTLTPVGQHASMGVHESQSRLWENQIGRSRAFCKWLFPHFVSAFPSCGLDDEEQLYRVINRVETGFIRTESDEVHYNLHVLLRFELERDLISGELDVDDLQAEWNARFERDFGVAVPDAARGVLQDVHWPIGLFGYFPTYSLGNIYAGQLSAKLRKDQSDLDSAVARGEMGGVLSWLGENVHQKGSLLPPGKIISETVGEDVSAEPLLNYLEQKYSDIFGL